MYFVFKDNVVMCYCSNVMFLNFKKFDYSVLICLFIKNKNYLFCFFFFLERFLKKIQDCALRGQTNRPLSVSLYLSSINSLALSLTQTQANSD